jgi:hypothetical protein
MELSDSHVVVPGVNKHVALGPVVASIDPLANPDVPVMGVKVIVAPGSTSFVSGVAFGAPGAETVGVIVASTYRPSTSATWYPTGAAVPTNVGSGSNVTTPVVVFTVKVPSPGTTREVFEQLFGVSASSMPVVAGSSIPHKRNVAFDTSASEINESLVSGLMA